MSVLSKLSSGLFPGDMDEMIGDFPVKAGPQALPAPELPPGGFDRNHQVVQRPPLAKSPPSAGIRRLSLTKTALQLLGISLERVGKRPFSPSWNKKTTIINTPIAKTGFFINEFKRINPL